MATRLELRNGKAFRVTDDIEIPETILLRERESIVHSITRATERLVEVQENKVVFEDRLAEIDTIIEGLDR